MGRRKQAIRKGGLIVLVAILTIGLFPGVVAAEKLTLRVGAAADAPPYSYQDPLGQPAGFHVEIIRAIAEEMDCRVEFSFHERGDLLGMVRRGELDLAAALRILPEYRDTLSFSDPHSDAVGDIFSRTENAVRDVEEIRGRTVVVVEGDPMIPYLDARDLDLEKVVVQHPRDAVALVADGTYAYAALLGPSARFHIRGEARENIRCCEMNIPLGEFAVAVVRGNEEMLTVFNEGLRILRAEGTYDRIYENTLASYQPFERTFLDQYRTPLIAAGAVLAGLLVAWMLWRTRPLKRRITDLETDLFGQEDARDQAEKEAREHKDLIAYLPDLLLRLDGRGIITALPQKDIHREREDLGIETGKSIAAILSPDREEDLSGLLATAREERRIARGRYSLTRPGQEERHYEFRAVPLDDGFVAILRDISEQVFYEKSIEYISTHDQLTGAGNRWAYEEDSRELEKTEEGANLGILMIDVDGLKVINDSLGHRVGDETLVTVAELLRENTPERSRIYRVGGDEFVLFLPQTTMEELESADQQIQAAARRKKIGSMLLSLSVGRCVREEGQTLAEAVSRAEYDMYRAKLAEGRQPQAEALETIQKALFEKNTREMHHARRVSEICAAIGRALHLAAQEQEDLETAGLLHDIGKVGISESILDKEGTLDADEYEEVKKHSEIGYRILHSTKGMSGLAQAILAHHERWDGTGYPQGYVKTQPPLFARVIGIADAYDAMTRARSYRDVYTKEEAIEEMKKQAGKQFDPYLLDIFIRYVVPDL